jgi:hypothetical protein
LAEQLLKIDKILTPLLQRLKTLTEKKNSLKDRMAAVGFVAKAKGEDILNLHVI